MSNPKFEYWLLLHFEDGKKASDSKTCTKRLKKYLVDGKNINPAKINRKMILKAVERAKRQNSNPAGWPKQKGTTVYRLIENIFKAEKDYKA
ncbi:hypothetical protein L21SP3_01337 [Sedimentisphaera cyanobacteriorum]|uniref:RloB-like protein n=1 Tax=Sedimentisphaera cyanobacteriorum TaxID=1940790 RepID=A0A1Q2HQC7_9BACT|nr:hypothetical protein L21SP3_01337 [Sedimentisphaera cyanobacteriorum]